MKESLSYALLFLWLLLCLWLNIAFAGDGFMELSNWNWDNFVFKDIRLTKALTAIMCGLALPVAGNLLQILFRNPLAGPYVLGISSASSFFVSIYLLLGVSFGITFFSVFNQTMLVLFALAGSLLCTLLIIFISSRVRNHVTLLIIGLMLGQVFGSLQTLMEYFSNDKSLRIFITWGYGSLGNTGYTDLFWLGVLCFICFLSLVFLLKPIQAFLLGDLYAQSLGYDVKRYRMYIIIVSSALTGVVTAFCGPIAFIGLSVPIMTRLLFKTSDQKKQLSYSALLGAGFMLLCDFAAHNLMKGNILPINLITTLAGSPFVIYLLFKNKNY